MAWSFVETNAPTKYAHINVNLATRDQVGKYVYAGGKEPHQTEHWTFYFVYWVWVFKSALYSKKGIHICTILE